jgi:Zn-dependent peptidase ImmA (M78 family)/transcriptional regulator with XRE-family HTH domain
MINERVRHARLYHGWSQKQLAEMISVSQPALSQIEKTGQIADETLSAIAEGTGFALWWFRQGPLPDLPLGSLRFRKLASATLRDDERVRANVRQGLEVFDHLSADAEVPPVRIEACPAHQALTDEDIEIKALEAREWLGVGPLDPIPSVVRAVERAGVVVMRSALQVDKHDALSFWSPDSMRPVIYFSRGFVGDHQRLSVAHEVGHLTLHRFRSIDRPQAESEAFRFASALLIPATAASEEIDTPVTLRSLAYVKARWGISIGALIRRCLDLHIISDERRTSLEKQLSTRGWRRSEPVHVPDETPVLMAKLIEATIGKASPHRLHAALGLPALACKDLMN